MKLFKSNWTKWVIVHSYEYCGNGKIILSKYNKKTGMVKFRLKNVNPWISAFASTDNAVMTGVDFGERMMELTNSNIDEM